MVTIYWSILLPDDTRNTSGLQAASLFPTATSRSCFLVFRHHTWPISRWNFVLTRLLLSRLLAPLLQRVKSLRNQHSRSASSSSNHRLALNLKKHFATQTQRSRRKRAFRVVFCSCSVGKEQLRGWNGNFWAVQVAGFSQLSPKFKVEEILISSVSIKSEKSFFCSFFEWKWRVKSFL